MTPWRGGGIIGDPARTCGDIQLVDYEWYYNWSPTPYCPNAGVPFVPMVHGSFKTLPPNLYQPGALLTFNEPDATGLTVDTALDLWPELEETGRKLSSPATTATPRGTSWLAEFMVRAVARDLRVDFLAAHWYGANPTDLVNYLTSLSARYDLPIWLTEFCCYGGSVMDNARFARTVGPRLAELPFLSRVGWFANRSVAGGYEGAGLVSSGGVTMVGSAYRAWQR